jgi:hypothetical protein
MGTPYNPRKALAVLNMLQAEGVPYFMTEQEAVAVCEYYGAENVSFIHLSKTRRDVSIVAVARKIANVLGDCHDVWLKP